MKKLTKISIIGSLVIITIFIILFLRYPRFSEITKQSNISKVYYADNISNAHKFLINKFNKNTRMK